MAVTPLDAMRVESSNEMRERKIATSRQVMIAALLAFGVGVLLTALTYYVLTRGEGVSVVAEREWAVKLNLLPGEIYSVASNRQLQTTIATNSSHLPVQTVTSLLDSQDTRVPGSEWGAKKPEAPYGQM